MLFFVLYKSPAVLKGWDGTVGVWSLPSPRAHTQIHTQTHTHTVSFLCAAEEKKKRRTCTFRSVSVKMKLLAALQAFEGIENSFLQSPHRQVGRRLCKRVSHIPPGGFGTILCSLFPSVLWLIIIVLAAVCCGSSALHPATHPPRLRLDNPYLFLPFEL